MQIELVMLQRAKPSSLYLISSLSLTLYLSNVTQTKSCKENSHPELFSTTFTSCIFLLSLVELLIMQRYGSPYYIIAWKRDIMYHFQHLSFNVYLIVVSNWKAGPRGVLLDTVPNDKEYVRTEVLKFWKGCPKVGYFKGTNNSIRSHSVISKLHGNMQYLSWDCAQLTKACQEKRFLAKINLLENCMSKILRAVHNCVMQYVICCHEPPWWVMSS